MKTDVSNLDHAPRPPVPPPTSGTSRESSGKRRAEPNAHASSEPQVVTIGEAEADPAPAQRPPWLRKREAAAAVKPPPVPGRRYSVAVRTSEDDSRSLTERITQWFVSRDAVGLAVSSLLHLLVMVVLSIIVYTDAKQRSFSTTVTEALPVDTRLDEIETEIDLDGGASLQLDRPQFQAVNLPQPRSEQPLLPVPQIAGNTAAAKAGQGEGEGEGLGDGAGLPFRMPAAGKVVSKGSFTAWTVPEDPAPGQNYLIIIQIELPDDVRRFPRRDLLGSIVIGTDGYKQAIPDNPRGFLPMKDRQAQMVILVPGASQMVKDMIQLKSRILKEKQTLEIVF